MILPITNHLAGRKSKKEKNRELGQEFKVANIDTLKDRIEGAWLGRCIGCLLGKPVEGWSQEEIEEYLKATDSYPLKDYFIYAPEKNCRRQAYFSSFSN